MPNGRANAQTIFIEAGSLRVEGQLLRHLSPRTFSSLVKLLPVTAPLVFEGKSASILSNLELPVDKYTNNVKTGDIVYRPKNGALCIFLQDDATRERLVPIGKVKDPSMLQSLRGSSIVRISSAES